MLFAANLVLPTHTEAAGDPAIVEFEDWEPLASAREVDYLWPNGDLLSEEEKSRLDDYVIFAPTADPTSHHVLQHVQRRLSGRALHRLGSAAESVTVPSDPDARITKMKDGTTHLAHKAEPAVDTESRCRIAGPAR